MGLNRYIKSSLKGLNLRLPGLKYMPEKPKLKSIRGLNLSPTDLTSALQTGTDISFKGLDKVHYTTDFKYILFHFTYTE